jgi:hypothetical protein
MGEAIGTSLPFAVGLAASPFPLVAMVLILAAPGGRGRAIAFAAAGIAGVAGVGALVLVLAGDEAADSSGDPRGWVSALRLVLGLLLLAYAAKAAATRGRDAPSGPPAWMRALDGMGPVRAAGMGALASALNPKNLALTIAGAAAIAQADLAPGPAAASLAVFTAIGTLGLTVPLGASLLLGPRSAPALGAVKDWAVRNNGTIMGMLALVFGVTLVGEAIAGF